MQRREPVSLEEWNKSLDPEGRLVAVESMKQKIFRGVGPPVLLIVSELGCLLAFARRVDSHFLMKDIIKCCVKRKSGGLQCRVLSLQMSIHLEKIIVLILLCGFHEKPYKSSIVLPSKVDLLPPQPSVHCAVCCVLVFGSLATTNIARV